MVAGVTDYEGLVLSLLHFPSYRVLKLNLKCSFNCFGSSGLDLCCYLNEDAIIVMDIDAFGCFDFMEYQLTSSKGDHEQAAVQLRSLLPST